MNDLVKQIAECIEFGKINQMSPYPPQMKGLEGADELTKKALEEGITPAEILDNGLVAAMAIVGQKFSENKIFIPQMLLAAKAMSAAMVHLKPYFSTGVVSKKGTVIIGTVVGDLHDIGKNLCAMMIEGSGYEVIDLGVDVKPEQFVEALKQNPGAFIGTSALLTTTMVNIESVIKAVRVIDPNCKIMVGGAPLNEEFAKKIGANFYGKDPQAGINYLNSQVA
jgi:5-methyltetrahydrofolate--homocysteine methyltransferase